jgi:hypothetical protein
MITKSSVFCDVCEEKQMKEETENKSNTDRNRGEKYKKNKLIMK